MQNDPEVFIYMLKYFACETLNKKKCAFILMQLKNKALLENTALQLANTAL